MPKLFSQLEDALLSWLQRRCNHPGKFIAIDKSEGLCSPYLIRYCRRCGALRILNENRENFDTRLIHPDPNLFRG